MNKIKWIKWLSLIAGVMLIIGGITLLVDPLNTTLGLVQFISSILIAVGIIRVIRYFSDRKNNTGSMLVGGIIDIILGIMMFKNLTASTIAFTTVISFWVLMNATIQIVVSIDFRKIGVKNWWINLILGIIGTVFGIMLIGNFGLSATYISILVASYFIMFGLGFIATFFGIRRLEKRNRYY